MQTQQTYAFQPCYSKILITIRDLHAPSSIVRPDNVAELNPYGEVISVGPNCKHTQPGDRVLFFPHGAVEINILGQTYHIIDEGSVFGKYVPTKPLDIAG